MQENNNVAPKPTVHEVNFEKQNIESSVNKNNNKDNGKKKTKKSKKSKKSDPISNLILLVAIGLFAFAGFRIFEYFHDINTQKRNGEITLLEAKDAIDSGMFDVLAPEGTAIGTVELVGLTGPLPILVGEDEQLVLDRGVGLLNGTSNGLGLPGSNSQVFLSAHRETFFNQLRHVRVGDTIRITMPYGVFEYRVSHTRVVHETETSVMNPGVQLEQDELVLMTCYPFNFWDTANERYLVYAYPIN